MPAKKHVQQNARLLFKLSFENGRLTGERVAGVLGYLEKTKPAQQLAILRAYERLVAAEVARSQAVIEHAGAVSPTVAQGIAALFSQKYARPIEPVTKANPALLAGLHVRVGDDVYENSVASQLSALAAAT